MKYIENKANYLNQTQNTSKAQMTGGILLNKVKDLNQTQNTSKAQMTGGILLNKVTAWLQARYDDACEEFTEAVRTKEKKLSFAEFLLKTANTNNDIFDVFQNNIQLRYKFLSLLMRISEEANYDFRYCYCLLQGKKQIELRMDIQYQEKLNILKRRGYNIQIEYVTEGDVFNEKIIVKNGVVDYDYIFEKKTYELESTCASLASSCNQLTDDIIKIFDEKIKFAFVIVVLNGKAQVLKISKNELSASLQSSLYKFSERKACYKERIGLKAMLDIAIIHILYNRLINFSYQNTDDEYNTDIEDRDSTNKDKKQDNDDSKQVLDSFINGNNVTNDVNSKQDNNGNELF